MKGALWIALAAGVLTLLPSGAGEVGLTFWVNVRQMPQSTCRERADLAITGSGLAVVADSDWWVYGAGDGHTAFASCTGIDANRTRVNVTVASLPWAADVNEMPRRIVALLDDPGARRYPPPVDTTNYAGIIWWVDIRPWTVADCQSRGQRALTGAGMTTTGASDWYVGAEDAEVDAYLTCSPHAGQTSFVLAVAAPPGVVIEDDLQMLLGYVDDPSSIPPAGDGREDDGEGGDGTGDGGDGRGADLTARRTATTTCGGAAGADDVRDVRFTLAAPTSVRVLAREPAGSATWWIQEKDYSGPILANVDDGRVVVAPPGSDIANGYVALPAGTYIFHVDCDPSGVGTVSAEILLPPMPSPDGPRYLASAKDQSDRVMLLTAAQQVDFVDTPPTGSILDFEQSLLWSRDGGRLEPWSTRDLLPVGHCLHGEWPDGPDRTFAVEFIGPPQPAGQTTTLRATSRAVPGGVEESQGVQFRLGQPQVVKVLNTDTGWIIDSDGYLWFNIVDGEVQSGSSWVQSTGRVDRYDVDLPGVLLPSGTYHFAVSSTSGAASGQVRFVGEALDEFPWPAVQTHWCYPALHDTIELPAVGAGLALGGIPEAIDQTWPEEPIETVKWEIGDEEGMVTHETHLGDKRDASVMENLWIEVHPDPADQRDFDQWVQRRVQEGELTAFTVPGTNWTAYLREAESTVVIDLGGGQGPMAINQRFEMRCGRLQVSGASAQFTGATWTRGEFGPQYDITAAEAELRARAPAVRRQVESLIQRIVQNLEARGLCRQ